MIPIPNKGVLDWISKHRTTAIIIILIAGNVYQYIDHKTYEQTIRAERTSEYVKSIQYERERSEKLEQLLTKIVKTKVVNEPPQND